MSEEDPKWQDAYILNDRIDRLQERIKQLEFIVRDGKDNLRSEYERHDQMLTRMYSVFYQDATGKKGLFHDVDVLMGRRNDEDESRGLKWQAWAIIVGAILTFLVGILHELPKIKIELQRIDPLEKPIERAKRPRGRKIARIRFIPNPDSSTDSAKTTQ